MQQAGKLSSPIPGLPRPAYLDGTLAADAGFDPLDFAVKYKEGVTVNLWLNPVTGLPFSTATAACKPTPITLGPNTKSTEKSLVWMREAEVKHARLAMLAAAGWPLAELWHGPLSNIFGLPYGLDSTQGRSLSVLNGGLGDVWPFIALATLGASYIECSTLDQVHGLTAIGKTMKPNGQVVMKSYVPGDCGFDPLNLYGFLGSQLNTMDKMKAEVDPDFAFRLAEYNRREMETAELKNGRLAMLAITGYAIQEAIYRTPVVDQTPIFFTSFGDVLAPGALKSLGLF
jgi:light-harvesting complex II chlorophyll a/b binding protein 4